MSKYIELKLALNKLWRLCEEDIEAERPEAFEFARAQESLQSLPTIEVSEDCISREYLKSFEYINKGDFNSVETIREWIDNAPSVVPTTEQSSMVGEWKREVNEKLGKCLRVVYVCSACGCAVGCENFVRRSYCPNCGAKMKGADNE